MQKNLSCRKCKACKPISDFRTRSTNGKPESQCKECERQYQKDWYWKNVEKGRTKAAASMRKLRADPDRREAHLEKQRANYHAKAKYTERAYYEKLKSDNPWDWRARNLKRNCSGLITTEWLHATWALQGGKCVLSGRVLDVMTFQIDHIIPKSRGGSDELSNLQILSPEANQAKGGMTDAEFISLCNDVIRNQIPELIGRAILAAEAGK